MKKFECKEFDFASGGLDFHSLFPTLVVSATGTPYNGALPIIEYHSNSALLADGKQRWYNISVR